MTDIEIRPFAEGDSDAVTGVILPIQREKFGIPVTVEDQPDLTAIPSFYQSGKGQFWVAFKGDTVIGTIGLKDIGNDQTALRKMFVAADFRGREHGVAKRLLDTLFQHARDQGVKDIFLGTTDKFLAAHRFYEKNGFGEIAKTDLPAAFPVMAVEQVLSVCSGNARGLISSVWGYAVGRASTSSEYAALPPSVTSGEIDHKLIFEFAKSWSEWGRQRRPSRSLSEGKRIAYAKSRCVTPSSPQRGEVPSESEAMRGPPAQPEQT